MKNEFVSFQSVDSVGVCVSDYILSVNVHVFFVSPVSHFLHVFSVF